MKKKKSIHSLLFSAMPAANLAGTTSAVAEFVQIGQNKHQPVSGSLAIRGSDGDCNNSQIPRSDYVALQENNNAPV